MTSTGRFERYRVPMLWLAAARVLIGIVAIPLAPFLYREHFLVLVLMRPTKEVLLAGGYFAKLGERVDLPELIAAAVPLSILGVWHMFALGRAYANEIHDRRLPGLGSRILQLDKIRALQKALRRKGARLIVIGRLAVFPSALLGAAAGSSRMKTREFLRADGIGGVLALVEVIGAGYALGEAYDEAGPWLTVAGVAALVAGGLLVGRWIRHE